MLRDSTESNYNAQNRAIEWRIDIYFNGESNEPLVCTRDNYLVDCDLLLEACASSETFIGVPSSNEVSFQLVSADGLFNPAKTTGEYYGKMLAGVKVTVYCRPVNLSSIDDDYNWDALGVYFITDWQTDITGITASIIANDVMYNLLNDKTTILPVQKDYSYEYLCMDFFEANNITCNILGDLSEELSFAYVQGTNASFIADISVGALAYIFCDNNGEVSILDINRAPIAEYTITDHNQIISVTSKQSAMLTHNGVDLTYHNKSLSTAHEVLSVLHQVAKPGQNYYSLQEFSSTPLYAISHAIMDADTQELSLSNISASSAYLSYAVYNASDVAQEFNIVFYGYTIEDVAINISDNASSLLAVDNAYIQNTEYAEQFIDMLQRYIRLAIPVLELEVRGNPLIRIGSVVRVISTMYNLDFTGMLIRQSFRYDGGMSATMSILNLDIIGG